MFWKTGKLISLSEQNLVDCSWPQGNEGCNSGFMDNSFRYNPKYSVANDTGFVDIPSWEKDLAKAVATVGPVPVAVDASHFSFQFYKKGIYFEPRCDPEGLDHAMLAVGYGYEGADSDNNKYWLVKNRYNLPERLIVEIQRGILFCNQYLYTASA
ncbi:hypothetical protein H8959_009517 [Pygathrix nigripes]